MLIKKKLLYFAVNEISTKAFAVHNWVCGQGVGERPNQEVHPGHTINLSPYEPHLVLIKRTSGYPVINMFTPSGWNWLLLALVGGEGRIYEKSDSYPYPGYLCRCAAYSWYFAFVDMQNMTLSTILWEKNLLTKFTIFQAGQLEFTGGGWSMNDEVVKTF